MTTENKIDMSTSILTLDQLLKRPFWKQYSLANLCELANRGLFGFYCKIGKSEQKRAFIINEEIPLLMNHDYIKKIGTKDSTCTKEEFDRYLKLNELYNSFIQKKSLLGYKPNYMRLPTNIETSIWPLCEESSINCFLKDDEVSRNAWNNSFGFFLLEPDSINNQQRVICPTYYLARPIIESDLIVFSDQILYLEKEIAANGVLDPTTITFDNSNNIRLEQLKINSRLGGQKTADNHAKIRAPFLDTALNLAKQFPKKYSAKKLAEETMKIHWRSSEKITSKALAVYIIRDPYFASLLK